MREIQRARLLAAAAEVVADSGYTGMSTARVTTRAGVSRKTFYDLFENREDCFLAMFEEAAERASVLAREAASGQPTWRARVRAGLAALLQLAEAEPGSTSLLVKDALGCGPRVLASRARWLDALAAIVEKGREEGKEGTEPPALVAEGVVGAVLAVLHARMLVDDPQPPIELLNPLMSMIVLPYLGSRASARELTRDAPALAPLPSRPSRMADEDLPGGIGMRVTYRTLLVLSAIADDPGASNREIAATADVHDQGQISKLLTRLAHLDLICNTGRGHTTGEPNAWSLTAKGAAIEHTIRPRTAADVG